MTIALLLPDNWEVRPFVDWSAMIAEAHDANLLVVVAQQRTGMSETVNVERLSEVEDPPLREALENLDGRFAWRELDAAEPSGDRLASPEKSPEERPDGSSCESNDGSNATTANKTAGETPDEPSPETPSKTLPDSLDAAPGNGTGEPPRTVRVSIVRDPNPAAGVLKLLDSAVDLLILPRHHADRMRAPEFALQRQLFRDAPCAALQLRLGDNGSVCRSVVVPAGDGLAPVEALNAAAQIAKRVEGGSVKAVYVEPQLDDVAELVGDRIVKRVAAKVQKPLIDVITTHVVIDDDLRRGIERARDWGCDLLMLGVERHGIMSHVFSSSVSEQLISSADGPTVAVLRPAARWTSRVWGRLEDTVRHHVPQLDRGRRVDLVERIQSSSRWDFDFVALMCLSTLIATLGLLQNSVAVVIGAMLVAPLMTPLLGAGLSLVQGNSLLFRSAWLTIARGFLVAFAIGAIAGLTHVAVVGASVTTEMSARGSPGVTDLLVAFVSGLAAAYAIGRPNLVSALPGVAIAAALVPPIATSGLCLAMSDWSNSAGAALLFLTNIVAIVLGASCALWLAGIRSGHEHGRFATWAPRVAIGLLVAAILLAVIETWY